jgi:hypothetical protein
MHSFATDCLTSDSLPIKKTIGSGSTFNPLNSHSHLTAWMMDTIAADSRFKPLAVMRRPGTDTPRSHTGPIGIVEVVATIDLKMSDSCAG